MYQYIFSAIRMGLTDRLNTFGFAGISTFERDQRISTAGKRVKGVQIHNDGSPDSAGLATQRLAETSKHSKRPKVSAHYPNDCHST